MTLTDIPTAYAVDSDEIMVDENFDENLEAQEITTEMKKCYSLSITVKYFASIDFLFSLFFAVYNNYFFLPLLLISFGYYGAKDFNLASTIIYFLYTVCINIIRSVVFFDYYYHLNADERGDEMFNFVVLFFCFFIGLWISRIIYSFARLMSKLSEEELKERETKRMKEDFQSIEILTESLIVQMIHSLTYLLGEVHTTPSVLCV